MSFETLPNELLAEIFSFCSSEKFSRLSLVCQRWHLVIARNATLQLSKTVRLENSYPCTDSFVPRKVLISSCVPLEVLMSSSREYTRFSCSLFKMDSLELSDTLKKVFTFCNQRWTMRYLFFEGTTETFSFFLRNFREFFNDVEFFEISVKSIGGFECGTATGGIRAAKPKVGENLDLSMEKLQQLYFNQNYSLTRPPLRVTLNCPNLDTVHIKRCNDVTFDLRDCPKLNSARICRGDIVECQDPLEVRSILSQSPLNITRIKLEGIDVIDCAKSLFENLQEISINNYGNKPFPTDHPLNCPRLTKLELFVKHTLKNPLELKTPQLRTLITYVETVGAVNLTDASRLEQLVIVKFSDMNDPYSQRTNQAWLSHVRALELRYFRKIEQLDGLWQHLGGITNLTMHCGRSIILGSVDEPTHHFKRTLKLAKVQEILENQAQITSLRLYKTNIETNDLTCLSANLQTLIIEDCETGCPCFEISPSIDKVVVRRLAVYSSFPYSFQLLQQDKLLPLHCMITTWCSIDYKFYYTLEEIKEGI